MSPRFFADFRHSAWPHNQTGEPGGDPVQYPELPAETHTISRDTIQSPIQSPRTMRVPGGRGIFMPRPVSPLAGRLDELEAEVVSQVSTSFSTVGTSVTEESSGSYIDDFPGSTQSTVEVPYFDHTINSDEQCLPPHQSDLDTRSITSTSPTPSLYAASLTTSEWGELGTQADEIVLSQAVPQAASQTVAHEFVEHTIKPFAPTQSAHPCLSLIWPMIPPGFVNAPVAVQWEAMRVLSYCGVDPVSFDEPYRSEWVDQKLFWAALKKHDMLREASMPEMCDSQAWKHAITGAFGTEDNAVVLVCIARMTGSKVLPQLTIALSPLKLEQSCRLFRKYRSSRFLELRIPALADWGKFEEVDEPIERFAAHEFTRGTHNFLGRQWSAFFVKESGHSVPVKDIEAGEQKKKRAFQDRIMLFSERSGSSRDDMLNWLLQFERNKREPFLKLYSRISQALSKSIPMDALDIEQIRHHDEDITSPSGTVMNDGVGRVSRSVMAKIRVKLGLTKTPSAFQARLGSAKGMWIVDVTDSGDLDWVETYRSQRKWECNWHDEFHRKIEIKCTSDTLVPARLNLQTMQILADRAVDQQLLYTVLGNKLIEGLRAEFQELRDSMDDPLLLRHWTLEQLSFVRQLPDQTYIGGVPNSNEDRIAFLLDAGFDARYQKYLQEAIYQLQRQKCERLSDDLKISLGKSTFALMVVDFEGVLKPDEVHLCFSHYNDGENDWRDLDGFDVLVSRCPAHLPSDIQRVKAVFKPELRHLRDVIIFSRNGDGPLADKLSGGDYDGDRAWVCWDQDIVRNFHSAQVPTKPNFDAFFREDKTSVDATLFTNGERSHLGSAVQKFFEFSLKPRFLGLCTNYKEKVCYHKGGSSDPQVIALSWLLSELVDLPKKGLIFDEADWENFKAHFLGPKYRPPQPEYNRLKPLSSAPFRHVIDHLKFSVSLQFMQVELAALGAYQKSLNANFADEDLLRTWDEIESRAVEFETLGILLKGSFARLRTALDTELEAVFKCWNKEMGKKLPGDYRKRVAQVFTRWKNITAERLADARNVGQPETLSLANILILLTHLVPLQSDFSYWELLKSLRTFKLYHYRRPRFVWCMAGIQLQYIKSFCSGNETDRPVPVNSTHYGALRTKKSLVKQMNKMAVSSRARGHIGDCRDDDSAGSDEEGGADEIDNISVYELE